MLLLYAEQNRRSLRFATESSLNSKGLSAHAHTIIGGSSSSLLLPGCQKFNNFQRAFVSPKYILTSFPY